MARVVDMIGFGGGEQQPVDAPAAEQRREPARWPGPERLEHGCERALQIRRRLRAAVERAEHVDEHDLPVEPAEVIAKERPHDMLHVAVVAARHHGGERAALRRRVRRQRKRKNVSSGEPSRSPGMRKRPGPSVASGSAARWALR